MKLADSRSLAGPAKLLYNAETNSPKPRKPRLAGRILSAANTLTGLGTAAAGKSAGRVHSQTTQERAHRCLLDDQKINLIANWICRSGIVVLVSKPAEPLSVPSDKKMSLLSGTVGGAKLGWFMMLNISTRNCTLKFSEIRLMLLFLKTEKSKLVMPGPIKMLRPALPRRLKHCRLGGVAVRSPP